jgi:hypothetical protein
MTGATVLPIQLLVDNVVSKVKQMTSFIVLTFASVDGDAGSTRSFVSSFDLSSLSG